MAKRPPPRRLFKASDHVSSYHAPSRSPMKRMKQVSEEHGDVLQNIEFALVTHGRRDPEMDDRHAEAALRALLNRRPADDPLVAALVEELTAIRQMRDDIPEDVWRQALQVVDESVKRHSQFRPGETSYLEFAGRFIP